MLCVYVRTAAGLQYTVYPNVVTVVGCTYSLIEIVLTRPVVLLSQVNSRRGTYQSSINRCLPAARPSVAQLAALTRSSQQVAALAIFY